MPTRPHIVIFNPDHYRGDVLGHLGNPAAVTPNLDRLVETGAVSFSNTFCQNPVCTPSRCSFMSGWYPHVRGHRTMAHLMHPDEPVLLRSLKQAGYWVWWGGKNDLAAGQLGYEEYCDVMFHPHRPVKKRWGDESNNWRGDPDSDTYYSFFYGKIEKDGDAPFHYDGDWANVLGAVDQILELPDGRPLCIYLPLVYPHPPYAVEEPYFSMIDREKVPSRIPTPGKESGKSSMVYGLIENYNMDAWSEQRWRELRAVYYGMCARVDHQVGMIIDALKRRGIFDDTAFFFFSDHGEYNGDYGIVDINQNTFEDSLTKVPMIIKPPAGVPVTPGVRDSLVELIDFPATVEALTGVSLSEDHFGKSLLPVIAGETDTHRDAVFCEGGRRHDEIHCTEMEVGAALDKTGMYWPRLVLQRSQGPEHSRAVMCRTQRYKYVRRLYEKDELYDLETDPDELNNRIDDPELAGPLADLKDRLLTFFLETGDVVPRRLDSRNFK